MSLIINIPPDLEARLQSEAQRHGVGAEEYAKQIIVQNLRPHEPRASLSDLFARWEAEDATDDPAEIARRNQEFEEFKEAMNRNRLESDGPSARKLFQ